MAAQAAAPAVAAARTKPALKVNKRSKRSNGRNGKVIILTIV